MHLQSITLRQFRSYRDLTLDVDPGVNLFLGLNGSGKTNLVEAIAVLATGVSPRGAETDDMALWGENGFYIGGQFGFDTGDLHPVKLEMKYRAGASRTIRKDEKTPIRLKDLLGFIPVVSFVPEDLSLVKGEPSLRRRAMNMILMQVDQAYAADQKRYMDTIRSRNAALKQANEQRIEMDALTPWDEALIEAGLTICQKRAAFLGEFSERAAQVHRRISGGKETLRLEYRPSFAGPWDDDGRERWKQKLLSLRHQEMALGITMVGPHRDDFNFVLNDRPARAFGSEGQKRTGAVSFKLAEIPFIQERKNQKPICLLDDVLSELDVHRAAHLLDELSRTSQCFVTLTGLESWPRDHDLPASIFRVDDAGIRPEKRRSASPEPAVAS